MESLLGKHWHHLPTSAVLDLLGTHAGGLGQLEVARRAAHFGPNEVAVPEGHGPLVRFLLQFHQPLVYVLLGAAAVTLLLRKPTDAAVILAVVVLNALIGFVQESKATQAIAALSRRLGAEAVVVRDGRRQRLPSGALVPGDIVVVQSGDKVPADLRLLEGRDLRADESALTGESVPAAKAAAVLPHDAPLAERSNMLYASTLLVAGQGTGVVVATGDRTEIGRISHLVATAVELETPLTRRIARFGRALVLAILALGALVFGGGIWRGQPAVDTFLAAVALVVAVIPEGLPAALTIMLAIGVGRMARRHAIVRKLPAVETLGSTTVICTDKTGTLTENQMTVQEIYAGGRRYTVSGLGYRLAGEITPAEGEGVPGEALRECLRGGLLCGDAHIEESAGEWRAHGDPTEIALVVSAWKGGLAQDERDRLPRRDVLPFDSAHQYMATLHDAGPGRPARLYLKGAVERVLERCHRASGPDGAPCGLDRAAVHAAAEAMAARGLRVLAIATGDLAAGAFTHAAVSEHLTFLGLQGMLDPPRPEAGAAIRACHAAGIAVKMITGDHPTTAVAIAETLGLVPGSRSGTRALTSRDLEQLSDAELIATAGAASVFARVTPEQKLRLVAALQARGDVVAMTGDGVNDAPALRQADIGVAMGRAGTDVAKGAADIVLTDDNFASIEAAVEEGRSVFDNLRKFIIWTLPTNLGQGLVILVAVVAGVTLPILPLQILYINMTTAVLLGLTLAFEPKEPDLMARPPRDPGAPLISRSLLVRMLTVAGMMLLGAFGLFEWALLHGASVAEARTVAVNVFVLVQILYLFTCRSLSRPLLVSELGGNRWALAGATAMLLLQVGFTYLPAANRLFDSAPLGGAAWLAAAAVSGVTAAVVEVEKRVQKTARRLTAGAERGARAEPGEATGA
jgi:Ca2+-transporting ATPase